MSQECSAALELIEKVHSDQHQGAITVLKTFDEALEDGSGLKHPNHETVDP